jgi:hypothetical protein
MTKVTTSITLVRVIAQSLLRSTDQKGTLSALDSSDSEDRTVTGWLLRCLGHQAHGRRNVSE